MLNANGQSKYGTDSLACLENEDTVLSELSTKKLY